MEKIVVTDIFGKTSALIKLADVIGADKIVEPYGGEMMNFEDESKAYQYFTENVGFVAYVNHLSKIIKECTDEVTLIGFSVGATAIWQLSELRSDQVTDVIKHAICFYGSQIRHYTKLSPAFEIKLVFPQSEPHFDVLQLKNTLDKKPKVQTIQVDYLHGFMNVHSNNFNQDGYEKYMSLLQQNAL
jgi:dienelactone hydrolase